MEPKASKAKKAPTHHKPTAKQLEAINEAVRKAIGKGVAVAATIGRRYSDGPQGQPYLRYVLSNDHTAFVANWHRGEVHVSVSEGKLDPKSFTGKAYYAKQKRAEERIAAKKVADAKKAAQ